MSAAVQVQRAGFSQLDEVTPLFEDYLRFYGKSVASVDARRFIADRLENQDSVILVAMFEQRLQAFAQLFPSFASLSLAPSWILNDLYVAQAARGHGIGKALMQAARDLAVGSGAAEIFLQTARENSSARCLYEQLGYQRDDDFLVYTLPLPRN